mgnify:CR=1 FL=1
MMKDIIIMALEHEAPKMAKWENVFFSGVGKVNAALTAGKLIERYQPRTSRSPIRGPIGWWAASYRCA